jgi:hypothetical protein
MASEISQQTRNIQDRITALQTFKENSADEKNILKKAGDSLTNVSNFTATQLNKINELQKRYLRDPVNSLEKLTSFIDLTKGSGSQTLNFIKDKMLEAVVKMEPKAKQIVNEEVLKALGCSQEQTYTGFSIKDLQLQPISLLPVSQGIYIPVKSIDIGKNLINNPESDLGKVYYEKDNPSTNEKYKPYGGFEPYPFNKMLYYRMSSQNQGRSYFEEYKQYYNGSAGPALFDLTYADKNEFGVSGDFFRVFLINDEGKPTDPQGLTVNKVGEFVVNYYDTIKIVDDVDFTAQLTNLLTGAVSIKAQVGVGELENASKFAILIQRILGLCFDGREEIDVSGIAKIAELDGVDDSFFEFTEVDLRNIEQQISNIQLGIIQFEECDNISLPVNSNQIVEQLNDFRNQSGMTPERSVETINKILDSIVENPEWKILIPNNVGLKLEINKNIIKQIPVALASTILSPKVLFPIFTMLSAVETTALNSANQLINTGNNQIQDANDVLQNGTKVGEQVNNFVEDQTDFVKKFREFTIQVVSRLNEQFLRTLFEILKAEIFLLMNEIIKDIQKSQVAKKYVIIIRLVQLTYLLISILSDLRKCKSLLDEITLLLSMINLGGKIPGLNGPNLAISPALLLLTQALPGFSPERASINTIQLLQKVGIPTGPLPDGQPNKMLMFMKNIIKGIDLEESENGKVEAVIDPVSLVRVFGKKI